MVFTLVARLGRLLIKSRKPPPRALALLRCWVRVYLPVCCRFGSLHIGRFAWRPGFVLLVRLPLSIGQNTLSQMFQTYAVTSNFQDKALMSSICSNAFLLYYVELFKGCFANKLVVPGSPAETSNWPHASVQRATSLVWGRGMQRRLLANGTSKPAPAPPAGDATHLLASTPPVDVPPSVGNSGP